MIQANVELINKLLGMKRADREEYVKNIFGKEMYGILSDIASDLGEDNKGYNNEWENCCIEIMDVELRLGV